MEEYEEINLNEIFEIIWNKKFVIVSIIIIFALIGFLYTKNIIKPEYQATTTLVLVNNSSSSSEETITQTQVTLNQKLVATYTELIKTNNVLRKVIENTGINVDEDTLREKLSIKLATNSQIIEISVRDYNPENTVIIADEIAKVFIDKIIEIYGMSNINVVDNAKLPNEPYNINYKRNVMIFILIGLFVDLGYICASIMLDSTIKNAEQAEKRLKLSVLASIPQYNYKDAEKANKKRKAKNSEVKNKATTEKNDKRKGDK